MSILSVLADSEIAGLSGTTTIVAMSAGRSSVTFMTRPRQTRASSTGRACTTVTTNTIKIFWLDASEPEISTSDASKAALDFNNSLGKGSEVVMMYPDFHTQSIHDGLLSEGETDVVMLTRSAWAGMQRWCAALWSGDTSSHWPSLKVSI